MRAFMSDTASRNGLRASLWEYTAQSAERVTALRAEREARAILAETEPSDRVASFRFYPIEPGLYDYPLGDPAARTALAEALAAFIGEERS